MLRMRLTNRKKFVVTCLVVMCVVAPLISSASAIYERLNIYYSGRFIVYTFQFNENQVVEMRSYQKALENAYCMVWRIINDNFRKLGFWEKVIVVNAAELIIAYKMWRTASGNYVSGPMQVTLRVDPAIASACVTLSKVRSLWSSLSASWMLWYRTVCLPWTSLPIP
jgi:hypothetical protein